MEIKEFSPTNHKIKALIYGDSGKGKTTFGATAPNVIFASAEAGLLSAAKKRLNYVEIKKLGDLNELYTFLKNGKHKYETVVIDSITEINDIIKAELEARRGRVLQIQDYGEVARLLEGILRRFRDLNMHVIFIAQEQLEKDEDKVIKILPSLTGKTATKIPRYVDIVGYADITATGEYYIHTLSHPRYVTKDRSRKIGNTLRPDFKTWILAVESLEILDEEVIVLSEESDGIDENDLQYSNPEPTTPQAAKVPLNQPKKPISSVKDVTTQDELNNLNKTQPKTPPANNGGAKVLASAAQKNKILKIYEEYKKYKINLGEPVKPLNEIIAEYKLNGVPIKGIEELTIYYASNLITKLEKNNLQLAQKLKNGGQ